LGFVHNLFLSAGHICPKLYLWQKSQNQSLPMDNLKKYSYFILPCGTKDSNSEPKLKSPKNNALRIKQKIFLRLFE